MSDLVIEFADGSYERLKVESFDPSSSYQPQTKDLLIGRDGKVCLMGHKMQGVEMCPSRESIVAIAKLTIKLRGSTRFRLLIVSTDSVRWMPSAWI